MYNAWTHNEIAKAVQAQADTIPSATTPRISESGLAGTYCFADARISLIHIPTQHNQSHAGTSGSAYGKLFLITLRLDHHQTHLHADTISSSAAAVQAAIERITCSPLAATDRLCKEGTGTGAGHSAAKDSRGQTLVSPRLPARLTAVPDTRLTLPCLLQFLTPQEVKPLDLTPEEQREWEGRAKEYSRLKMAEHRAWQKVAAGVGKRTLLHEWHLHHYGC